jgi:hypothetical protein
MNAVADPNFEMYGNKQVIKKYLNSTEAKHT